MEERTYSEAEVGDAQAREARYILETLQAALEGVQAQRRQSAKDAVTLTQRVRRLGEVEGLEIALEAIRRRLR